jgi:hypothetical protein
LRGLLRLLVLLSLSFLDMIQLLARHVQCMPSWLAQISSV